MVFSSILFLFRFMPFAFLVYYILPNKFKNFAILILSLIFYSWGEPKYFPIMIASILIDYTAGQGIKRFGENKAKRRRFLIMSVIFNLGMLFFFKYTNFFITNANMLFGTTFDTINITLPLGISFYTFQTMSYTIDVFLGKVEAEDNIIDFGAFVCLFPQLIAGPIVKYTDVNKELKRRVITPEMLSDGVRLFIMGLGSKVLIANNIGSLWDKVVFLGFENISTPLAWLGVIAYSFQIYFDFSGYSLMAIGLGKMLGFNFPKNFDFPYMSRSVTEFWRRWHITLGSWLREYLYIPLGGNRVSPTRMYLNLFIVWFATGFWHGADWNFVIWGLYFGVFIIIEKIGLLKFLDSHNIISRIYLLFLVAISWAIFAVTDLSLLGTLLGKLFSFSGGTDWIYYLSGYAVIFAMAAFFSTPAIKSIYEKVKDKKLIVTAFLAIITIVSVGYLVDATYNPFLYFRF